MSWEGASQAAHRPPGAPSREDCDMCNSPKALFVFSGVWMFSSCLRQNVGRPIEDGSAELGFRSYNPSQEGLANTEIETATFALG